MNRREMLGLVAGGGGSLLVPGAVSGDSPADTTKETPEPEDDTETVTVTVEVVST